MLKKVSAFVTTDDKAFNVRAEALYHQREIDIAAYADLEKLKENAEEIIAYLKAFRKANPLPPKAPAAPVVDTELAAEPAAE